MNTQIGFNKISMDKSGRFMKYKLNIILNDGDEPEMC